VFEACPQLGWALIKPMLRCFLGKEANESDSESGAGSRSIHQRLLAVELVGFLVKASTTPEAAECLAKNIKLLTSVLI